MSNSDCPHVYPSLPRIALAHFIQAELSRAVTNLASYLDSQPTKTGIVDLKAFRLHYPPLGLPRWYLPKPNLTLSPSLLLLGSNLAAANTESCSGAFCWRAYERPE